MNVGSVSITASNNQRHHTEVDLRTVNQKSTLYHPPEGPRKWFIDEDFESVIPESYYLDNIEKFMRRDKGLEDTYRKSHRSITYGDKLEEIDARRRGIKRAYDETSYMPNYATVLPEHYFKNLRHVDLPSVGTYERLYTSRTGKTEVPNVVREADRQLASPGLGERFNRLTGLELYSENAGVIGSLFQGVGKVFDFAFGYEAYDIANRIKDKEFEGSISKYHRHQYGEDSYAGPFERMFSSIVQLATGTAVATAAYAGINLPIQHMFATVFQKSLDELLLAKESSAKPGMQSFMLGSIRNMFRSIFFGPKHGHLINTVLKSGSSPSEIRSAIQDGLEGKYSSSFIYIDDTIKSDKAVKFGAIGQHRFGSLGIMSAIGAVRKYDKASFDTLMRPIFEAMSPYDLQDADIDDASPAKAYFAALSELSETIGKAPEIEFDNPGKTGDIKKSGMRISNIGRDRVISIAKAYDTIGALLPANIAYWHPAIRKALKLPQFDPKTNLTIKDIVSFEEMTLWSEQYVKVASDFIKNPFGSIKNTLRVWAGEAILRTAETAMAMRVRNSSRTAGKFINAELNYILSNPETTVADKAKALERSHQAKIAYFEKQTDDLLKSRIYKDYTKLISEQDQLLRGTNTVSGIKRQVDADIAKGTDPAFQKQSEVVKKQLVRSKKLLAVVGVSLVANKLFDDFFIRSRGIDYGVQLKLRKELETVNGQVASFYYNPTPNGFLVAGGAAIVGTIGGIMIPTEMGYDGSSFSSRPGTPIGQLKNAHYNLSNQYNQQLAKVADSDFNAKQISADISTKSSQYMDALEYIGGERVNSRRRLRFNKGVAVAGSLLAMVGIKGLYSVHAAIGNYVKGNNNSSNPDAIGGVVSAIAESLIPESKRVSSNFSARDQAMIAVLSQYSSEMLRSSQDHIKRTNNIAHQITSPYGQVAGVVKIDSEGMTFGVGYQLMPVTGLGFSPTLPFGLNNKDIQANNVRLSTGATIIRALTFRDLSYKEDSHYEKMAAYLGASTAIGLTLSKLRNSFSTNHLLKSNSSYWVSREVSQFKSMTRPLAPFASLALEVPHRVVKGFMALPFVAAESFTTGVRAAFSARPEALKASVHSIDMPATPRIRTTLGPLARRAAPFYMAMIGARMLADTYYGVNADVHMPYLESGRAIVASTLLTGLTVGGLLDYTGVFASSDQIAVSLYGSKLTDHANPKIKNRYSDIKKRKIFGSRTLQKEIVGSLSEIETAILKTDKSVGPYRSIGKFKSTGARVATAFTVLYGTRAAAALAISGLSEVISTVSGDSSRKTLNAIYNTPLIGPTLRVISGIDPSSKSEIRPNRSTHSVKSSGIMNTLSSAASAVFGKDLARMIGLYSDTPDPFFGIPAGGFSFKDSGVSYYMQFASSGSDLSMSAYDMVKRSASLTDVISWRSLLEDGAPQDFRQFYERARGGNLRTKAARYKAFTNEELGALSSSGGLARALQIKNSHLRNLTWQSPKEQILEFLVEGYSRGSFASDSIFNGKLNKIYDPYSFLVGGIIGKYNSETYNYDDSETNATELHRWTLRAANGRSTRIKKYNPFTDSIELSQDQSVKSTLSEFFRYVPFLVGGIGAIGSLAFSIGVLSLQYNRNEYMKVYESSKLVRGVSLFSASAYNYEARLDDGSGRYKFYQVFSSTTKAEINTNVNGLISKLYGSNKVNHITANEIAYKMSQSHKTLIKTVNSYFSPTSGSSNLTSHLKTLLESDLSDTSISEFKTRFKNDLKSRLRVGFGKKIGAGSAGRNLYSIAYGVDLDSSDKASLDAFLDTGGKVDQALDAMADAAVDRARMADIAGSNEAVLKMAKVKQALEESAGTKQFISLVEQPNPVSLQPQDLIKQSINVEVEAREAANRKVQKVYSEGVLKAGANATMSIGMGAIFWMFLGREIYTTTESISLLSDNKTDRFTRKASADLLVDSAVLTSQALLISGLLTAASGVAVPGLTIAALSVAGLYGLGFVKKSHGGFLQGLEDRAKSSVSSFIENPIEGIARPLDSVGLGDPFRAVGRPAGFVAQQVMKTITAPIRFLTGEVIAPWLVEKTIANQNASIAQQMLGSMLLPETAHFSSMSFSPGRQTVWGTEPFVYGNPSHYFAYQRAGAIKRAASLDIYIEKEFIHPEVFGRQTGRRQEDIYNRMFRSSSGGRILSNFNLDSGYLSARLRQELKIKQGMLHLTVTSAPLKRYADVESFSSGLSLNSLVRSLVGWKLPSISGGVFDSLKNTSLKFINFPKSVSIGTGRALRWTGFDLPAHMIKLGVGNFKKGLSNISLFKDLRALATGLNTKIANPSINLLQGIGSGIFKGGAKGGGKLFDLFRNLSGRATQIADEKFEESAERLAIKMMSPRYRRYASHVLKKGFIQGTIDTFSFSGEIVAETFLQYSPSMKKGLRAVDGALSKLLFAPGKFAARHLAKHIENFALADLARREKYLLANQDDIKTLIDLRKSDQGLDLSDSAKYMHYKKRLAKYLTLRDNLANVKLSEEPTKLNYNEIAARDVKGPTPTTSIRTVDGVIEPKTAAQEARLLKQMQEGYGPDRIQGIGETVYKSAKNVLQKEGVRNFFRPIFNPINHLKGAFITADVGMSVLADSRVEALKTSMHGGYYRSAYVDQYSATGASHVATFVSNLRVNPLFSIAAVIGGGVVGGNIGQRVGVEAYDKRFEEENKNSRLIKQTLINTTLGTLAQSPTVLKMISQGRYGAAVARLSSGILVGVASGGLGAGLATQSVAVTYGSQLLDSKLGAKFGLESRASSSLGLGKKIARAKYQIGKTILRKTNLLDKVANARGALDSRYGRLLLSRGLAGKATRFTRGLFGRFGQVGGVLGKAVTPVLTALQLGFGAYDTVSAIHQASNDKVRSQEQFIENQKQLGRGVGTLGGFAAGAGIGSALGLPGMVLGGLTGLAGGLVAESLGAKYAKRATEKHVTARELAKNQAAGTLTGGLAGAAIGAGLVIGAGAAVVAGSALVVPFAVVAGAALLLTGIGSLFGYVASSEYTLRNKGRKNMRGKVVQPQKYASVEKSDPDVQPKPAQKKRNSRTARLRDNNRISNNILDGKRAQRSAIVASAGMYDSGYLTEEDYEKELERMKSSYGYLTNTSYTSLEEFDEKTFNPDDEETDALDQPWWANVLGFMNNIWDRGKSAYGSLSEKVKSRFGTAIGHGRNLFEKAKDKTGRFKDWVGNIADKTLSKIGSGRRGIMTRLGEIRKRAAEIAKAKAAEASSALNGIFGSEGGFDPVFRDGKAIRLSEEDYFNLLVMSIYETGGTGQEAVDVGAAILNRQAAKRHTDFYASSNTLTGHLFARGPDGKHQFQPVDHYGVTSAKNFDQAVAQLMKGNAFKTKASATEALNRVAKSFGDPVMAEKAEAHVDGRLFFKGITELGSKRAVDVWRGSKLDNFFHDEDYSTVPRTRADMLPVILDKAGYDKYVAQSKSRSSSFTLPNGLVQMNFKGHFTTGLGDDTSGEPGVDFTLHTPNDKVLGIPVAFPVDAKVNWIGFQGSAAARSGYGKMVELIYQHRGHTMTAWVAHLDNWAPGLKEGMILPAGTVFGTQGRTGSTESGGVRAWNGDAYAPGSDAGTHISIDFPNSTYEQKWDFVGNTLIPYLTGKVELKFNKPAPSVSNKAQSPVANKQATNSRLDSKYGHARYDVAKKSDLKDVGNGVLLHNDAAFAWNRMVQAAARDGINLIPGSGYRSVEEQDTLWKNQVSKHNGDVEKAAKISAPPGYSQHQTGYAIDLWDPRYGLQRDFDQSAQFKWMQKYGQQHGFELPFKKENDQKPGAGYEPWHWLFVGSPDAKEEYQKFIQSTSQGQLSSNSDTKLYSSVSPSGGNGGLISSSVSVKDSSAQYPEQTLAAIGLNRAYTDKAKVEVQTAEEERTELLAASFKPSMLDQDITPEQLAEEDRIRQEYEKQKAIQISEVARHFEKKIQEQQAIVPTVQIQTNRTEVAHQDTGLRPKKPSEPVAVVHSVNQGGKQKVQVSYTEFESAPYYISGYEETSAYSLMETGLDA